MWPPLRELLDNPIYRRESRDLGIGWRILGLALLAIAYVSFICTGVLALIDQEVAGMLAFFIIFVTALDWVGRFGGPALAADCLTQEKESGSGVLLVLTTFPRRRILLGKFFGRLRPVVPFLLAVVPLFFLLLIPLWIGVGPGGLLAKHGSGRNLFLDVVGLCGIAFVGLLYGILVPASSFFLGASAGMLGSTLCRSTAGAVASAYGIIAFATFLFCWTSYVTGIVGAMGSAFGGAEGSLAMVIPFVTLQLAQEVGVRFGLGVACLAIASSSLERGLAGQ